MGTSYSMQREEKNMNRDDQMKPSGQRLSRYSIDNQIADHTIQDLFPSEHVLTINRSPRKLVDLCVEAVCRNLPNMNGELPRGLPQEIVNMIFQSLLNHSALNSTTLNALSKCELNELPLSRCRGISDDWFYTYTCINQDSDITYPHSSSKESIAYDSQRRGFRRMTSSFDSDSSLDTFPSIENYHCEDGRSSGSQETVLCNIKILDLSGAHQLTDDGLQMLGGGLVGLETVRLDDCHSVVGRGLSLFADSSQLRHLSLNNCRCLTDDALQQISHLISITSLSLNGCRCLTDCSLQSISNLYRLSKLDLSCCDLITDDGIKYFDRLIELQELSLAWCKLITDIAIETLASHSNREATMRVLRLAKCRITEKGVAQIGHFSSLEELDLNGCSGIESSALVSTLEKLKHLKLLDVSYSSNILRTSWQGKINALSYLDLSYSNVRDTQLSQFSFIPQLKVLRLSSCPYIGDATIAYFTDNNVAPNLEQLDLSDTDITDHSLGKFAQFRKLTYLSLSCCNISNVGLRHLESMRTLEVLNLDSRDIDDEGLVFLKNLTNLRSLDLFSGRITDAGCFHLSKMSTLESLELCGGGITDIGCSYLALLENMQCLNLAQNDRITDRGAACLAILTKLKKLNLSCTAVSSDALRYFKNLKELQSIALFGCRGINDTTIIGDLENNLPKLHCVRTSNCSKDDGTVDCYSHAYFDYFDFYDNSDPFSSQGIMRERWAHNSNDEDIEDNDDD